MSQELLDVDEVRTLLADVIARHPDNVNPLDDDDGCLYTAPENPDRHCIVGQLAAEQGWTVPGPQRADLNALAAAEEFGWPLTLPARRYLMRVQRQADGCPADETEWGSPVPWREVKP